MTNASECDRDAVSFAAAIDSSSLIDPPRLETRVRLAHVSSPFGRGWVRVRSLNRKKSQGLIRQPAERVSA